MTPPLPFWEKFPKNTVFFEDPPKLPSLPEEAAPGARSPKFGQIWILSALGPKFIGASFNRRSISFSKGRFGVDWDRLWLMNHSHRVHKNLPLDCPQLCHNFATASSFHLLGKSGACEEISVRLGFKDFAEQFCQEVTHTHDASWNMIFLIFGLPYMSNCEEEENITNNTRIKYIHLGF